MSKSASLKSSICVEIPWDNYDFIQPADYILTLLTQKYFTNLEKNIMLEIFPWFFYYLIGSAPSFLAGIYQRLFSTKSYHLDIRDFAAVFERDEEDTLYLAANDNQIYWSSAKKPEWEPVPSQSQMPSLQHWISHDESSSVLLDSEQKSLVKKAIQNGQLSSPNSPVRKTALVVQAITMRAPAKCEEKNNKLTYLGRTSMVFAGIALVVGVGACCTGVGAPAGIALIFASLAIIGNVASITLAVAGGSTLLSHASMSLFRRSIDPITNPATPPSEDRHSSDDLTPLIPDIIDDEDEKNYNVTLI